MDRHRPKPSIQRRVFFDEFAVLLQGGCTQHLQFSPSQSRFEDIRRINGPLCRTGAHDGMHFIHKQNHIAAASDLCQYIPKPFFKFAPVFGACHQVGHIQADEPLLLQLRRYVAQGHPLCQSLRNGCFAHAGFSDQSRVVLILPAQNANHHIDLLLPTDDRFHRLCLLDQIHTELFQ